MRGCRSSAGRGLCGFSAVVAPVRDPPKREDRVRRFHDPGPLVVDSSRGAVAPQKASLCSLSIRPSGPAGNGRGPSHAKRAIEAKFNRPGRHAARDGSPRKARERTQPRQAGRGPRRVGRRPSAATSELLSARSKPIHEHHVGPCTKGVCGSSRPVRRGANEPNSRGLGRGSGSGFGGSEQREFGAIEANPEAGDPGRPGADAAQNRRERSQSRVQAASARFGEWKRLDRRTFSCDGSPQSLLSAGKADEEVDFPKQVPLPRVVFPSRMLL